MTSRRAYIQYDLPMLKSLYQNYSLQSKAAAKMDRWACRVFGQYLDTREFDGLQRMGVSWHEKADQLIAEEIRRLVRELDSLESLLEERLT